MACRPCPPETTWASFGHVKTRKQPGPNFVCVGDWGGLKTRKKVKKQMMVSPTGWTLTGSLHMITCCYARPPRETLSGARKSGLLMVEVQKRKKQTEHEPKFNISCETLARHCNEGYNLG
jgi:hypothetical protein